MTPGIQPQMVNNNVMMTDPSPLSITASGGKIMASMTLNMLISMVLFLKHCISHIEFQGIDE